MKPRVGPVLLLLAIVLLDSLSHGAQTNIRLSSITPGTERVTLVPNGDFEDGSAGWTVVNDMTTAAPPSGLGVPASCGQRVAAAHIDTHTLCHFKRTLVLEGNTTYVLSAYLWDLGDTNHHVSAMVVDLEDQPWEGQLAVYYDTAGASEGLFCYTSFTTPADSQAVTLRLFNEAVVETDDHWPYYPVGAIWDNIALTKAEAFSPPHTGPLPTTGDLDGDGDVDRNDFKILCQHWLRSDCESVANLAGDCRINLIDFAVLAGHWLYNTQDANDVPAVDPSTLTGKVMSGYQGWFTCPGDGADLGWFHWGLHGDFAPGSCSIDFWPDMSEMDPEERYATSFRHADGRTAHVFSSHSGKTVTRHFRWMRDYGLDGVFVQRFSVQTFDQPNLEHCDKVLLSCQSAARQYGRVYAVMYDLSGLRANQMNRVMDDFKHLVDDYALTRNPADQAYLHHRGKPVVAVWGIGFNDGRDYSLDECMALIQFLKTDPVYGGCTVMVGVPSYWRTLTRDCVDDPKVHDIILAADIVSPWAVGRFGSVYLSELDNYVNTVWVPDMGWCHSRGIDYLPVVFPGFSWYNLQGWGFDHIPRQGGQFLWRQYYKALKEAGASMIYQAMFDEVDEGTVIFKCSNDPPVGVSPFLRYDEGNGEEPDHYLWLVGEAGKMVRGEIPLTEAMPPRP